MPFVDAACHVFAITGYKDDENMEGSNKSYYSLEAPQTGQRVRRPVGFSVEAQIVKIVAAVRKEVAVPLSTEDILIFGGFRDGALQPEHMWIEYKGLIYDTMPEHDLHATLANSGTRRCPYLEKAPFKQAEAPFVKVKATTWQMENLKQAIFHKKENIGEGSSDDEKSQK